MNNQQLDKLKNIVKSENIEAGFTYYYNVELPFGKNYSKYLPVLSKNGIMYDYYKVAKDYLKHSDVNAISARSLFFYSTKDGYAKPISLRNITPAKAQSLINRNIALFTQIKNKLIENNLIDAINEI